MEEKKHRQRLAYGQEISEDTERDEAIVTVQKYFRGFKAREIIFGMRKEEGEFLGMELEDSKYEEGQEPPGEKEAKERAKIKQLQKVNAEDYARGLEEIKALVKLNEGPDIKQNMLDSRREWLKEILAMYQFKKVPKVEEYYTKKDVMMPLTPDQLEQRKAEEEQKAKEDKKAKDAKKGGKKGKAGKGKKNEQDEFKEGKNLLTPSENVLKLQEKIDSYNKEWSAKDETKNFNQKYETDLAKDKVMPNVNTEIE